MKLWRNHSLTIVLGIIGVIMVVWAWQLDEGKTFDTLISIGTAFLTVAGFYGAANFLRETAKPED